MEQDLVNHFKDLLKEPQRNRSKAIAKISKEIPKLITRAQNLAVMRVATLEEVEEVVKGLKGNKAPRPYGYTAEFYQACWNFIGEEILEVLEEVCIHQKVWPGLNSTLLTLIPKSAHSESVEGFRPITLCNVIYKIIATLMVKKLKPILPNIISPEQTGFMEGRKILDGLVVSQKIIHTLKQKKELGMMIKLDLSKVYDILNWKYLEAILQAYGFCNRWVKWILSMISTPNFSILLNEHQQQPLMLQEAYAKGTLCPPFCS